MGNALSVRNHPRQPQDLEARNRNTREFVDNFFINNLELREFGIFNGHGRPHYFKKARIKKTRFNKLPFDIKDDQLDVIDEESLYFKIIHSVPIRVSVTFMCSTHIKERELKIFNTEHSIKKRFRFALKKEVEESDMIVELPENFYLNFLKLKMKDPHVSSCFISIKEDTGQVLTSSPESLGVNVGLKPNKTLFTILNKLLLKDGRLYNIKHVYNVNEDLEANKKGPNTSVHVETHTECSICMSSKVNTLMLPCRHFATCFTCAQTLQASTNKCPICREIVLDFVKVYKK